MQSRRRRAYAHQRSGHPFAWLIGVAALVILASVILAPAFTTSAQPRHTARPSVRVANVQQAPRVEQQAAQALQAQASRYDVPGISAIKPSRRLVGSQLTDATTSAVTVADATTYGNTYPPLQFVFKGAFHVTSVAFSQEGKLSADMLGGPAENPTRLLVVVTVSGLFGLTPPPGSKSPMRVFNKVYEFFDAKTGNFLEEYAPQSALVSG